MKLGLSQLIVGLLAMAAPAAAERLELPSAGLESRIDFWKKVFTQYGADDLIIHDRFHVNVIYDIAGESDVESKTAAVRVALDEILANLDTPEALSLTGKQIRDAIAANGVSLSATTIRELRNNIHTQRGIKERFRDGIIRSGRYLESFQEVFEREGLPVDIALLPLVESSFENRSLSKAGAAGIWQFTRGTGRLYMTINRRVDQRLDPAIATRAAARLLRDNYKALGSWPLAITAYNHGRGGMMRAQNEAGPEITSIINEYRGRLFGYASMNFYTEFLAAVDVYKNYEQYFGQLTLDKPTMRKAAPAKTVATAKVAARTPAAKAVPADKYKVRKGDTLFEIAQKFGMSLRELMDLNNLRNSVIHAGQILLVK
jgi:membrane-bound lytic murein transglycosylase D